MFARFDRVVRCTSGHLFTTIWVPMASLKSVRLGGARWQRCPVGRHWTTVTRADMTSLSDAARAAAAIVHDIRIP